MSSSFDPKIIKSDSEWRALLTPDQYHVTSERGTERPFTGPFLSNREPGTYHCVACGKTLFRSETKYDSGSGWPSFYTPAAGDSVIEIVDRSHLMTRTEVRCADCAAHLGHVFEDGPQPTGLRYCVNGTALSFRKA